MAHCAGSEHRYSLQAKLGSRSVLRPSGAQSIPDKRGRMENGILIKGQLNSGWGMLVRLNSYSLVDYSATRKRQVSNL